MQTSTETLRRIPSIESRQMREYEQKVNLVLKNLKLQILDQADEEVLITTDPRYKHYKANEDSIILKNGLLIRKKYGGTVRRKYS